MLLSADFLFYSTLNDFLPKAKREVWIRYAFREVPAVKDAIEALGVPHPEVEVILLNGAPVPLLHPLHPHDRVAVYPRAAAYTWPAGYAAAPALPTHPAFVLDVHLGKLARALRMLGFDTCYENNYSDHAIAQLAAKENRVVLTRDIGLLKQKVITWGYWLRSQQPEEQLAEVLQYFNLAEKLQPFTRCLCCNGRIELVAKNEVLHVLPPKTKQYFHEFFRCPNCRQVYWKGSHYERMQQFVAQLRQQSQ
ncbi:Mut7-C RNAse domain-containing protein [Pontibacter chitinilyticus]|uniref:Mut7-C RNAse domain-containing protein n=1 Tax=Pontibacter chitinilyticus TaxID=2674989 RepID=UPI00321A1115